MFPGSLIIPQDNSGVKVAKIIKIYKRNYRHAVGDLLLVSARKIKLRTVKHVIVRKKKITKITKGQLLKALLVFNTQKFERSTLLVNGNKNSIVTIKKNFFYELIGTRVRTPIFLEVRKFKLAKLFALAYSII